jgi:hypothetical protein
MRRRRTRRDNPQIRLAVIAMAGLPLLAEAIDHVRGIDVIWQRVEFVGCKTLAQTANPIWRIECCRVPLENDGASVDVCVLVSFCGLVKCGS